MTLADPGRRFTAPAATARGVSWSGGLEVSLLRSLLSCCPILLVVVAVGEIKPPTYDREPQVASPSFGAGPSGLYKGPGRHIRRNARGPNDGLH